MLNYVEMRVDQRLEPFIRKLWVIDNLSPLIVKKKVLPNACFTLAIIAGEGLIVDFVNNPGLMTTGSYMVGELTRAAEVAVLPYTKALMVQLTPWVASMMSKCSFHEQTNQITSIIDMNKALALAFREVNIADNFAAKETIIKILDGYFYPTAASAFIASCFHLFDSHPAATPFKLTHLSKATSYSIRSIEKKFRQHVGLAPKQAYAILNLRKVVNELLIPENPLSLTTLSYKYGYTDQAHFTRSYFSKMGCLPSRFNGNQYILPLQM